MSISPIHVVLIHHGFHQNLDRRQRRFQLVRSVGDKLVARLVEVVHLLAHLVERGGELRHFALALHVDTVFIVALAHPLDAAGKLRDRPGHDAGDQPRQHQQIGAVGPVEPGSAPLPDAVQAAGVKAAK